MKYQFSFNHLEKAFVLSMAFTFSIISTNVHAELVTFRFEGILTEAIPCHAVTSSRTCPLTPDFGDWNGQVSDLLSVGDKFTGTYTFETTLTESTDYHQFSTGVGKPVKNNIQSFSFSSGNYSISSPNPDGGEILTQTVGLPFEEALYGISTGTYDYNLAAVMLFTGNWFIKRTSSIPVFPSQDMPQELFNTLSDNAFDFIDNVQLGDTILSSDPGFLRGGTHVQDGKYDVRIVFKEHFGGRNIHGGMFGNITSVTVVPIPAAIWLFGTGIIGLFGWNRRRIA